MEPEELRLGQGVRRLREERSLSLKQLAERASVSESFISQVERGSQIRALLRCDESPRL